jgi:glycosyltransferase involved in cell wall biosynthesis
VNEEGRSPRIVLVSATGLVSGAEHVLVGVARAARDAEWDVVVASPRGPLVDVLGAQGLAHCPLPDLKLGRWSRSVAAALAPAQAVRAARVLRRVACGADVVVGNLLLTLPAVRLARLDAAVVWYAHEFLPSRARVRIARWCGKDVDVAVCVSDAVARSLAPSGVSCRVVRNGTAWPIEPAQPVSDPVVIGECARLIPYKGQDVLLEAAALLGRRDVEVELVGGHFPRDRRYAEAIAARAAQPDLAATVRLVGEVSDPLDRMRRWSVAVLPTTEPDPAPLAVVEAMSLGVPVVTTDHGGSPEVLGDAGLLVPPDDPAAVAAAVARLLDDPDLRARCARAGREIVASRFTIEHQHEEVLELFDELCAARRARRP